jgi:hypothetical protein
MELAPRAPHFHPDIEVHREMERTKQGLPELHSVIGPGETQTFWGINAFGWNAWAVNPSTP